MFGYLHLSSVNYTPTNEDLGPLTDGEIEIVDFVSAKHFALLISFLIEWHSRGKHFFWCKNCSFLQIVVKLPIIFMYCLWPTIQIVQLTCVFRFDEGMCFLLWWILIAFLSVGFLCKSWIFKMVNNKTSIQRLANECLFIWISASQSPDVAISAAVERNNELLTLKFIKVYAMPNPFGIGIRNAFGDGIGNPLTYETIPVTY